ncbi:MAG: cytochrome c-type biogenesis protein CcmH [Acidobacteriota bacterium]
MPVSRLLKTLVLFLCLGTVAVAAGRSPAQIDQIQKDISNKVYCTCGCATTLARCPDPHCPVKAEMDKIIRTDLEQGKTEQAVLQDLVDHYGEKVLAAPPPKGFNLTAWILPSVGLLIGLFLAILVVRRWRRPALQAAGPASSATPPVDDNVRSAVEEEMKKFMD